MRTDAAVAAATVDAAGRSAGLSARGGVGKDVRADDGGGGAAGGITAVGIATGERPRSARTAAVALATWFLGGDPLFAEAAGLPVGFRRFAPESCGFATPSVSADAVGVESSSEGLAWAGAIDKPTATAAAPSWTEKLAIACFPRHRENVTRRTRSICSSYRWYEQPFLVLRSNYGPLAFVPRCARLTSLGGLILARLCLAALALPRSGA